MRPRLQVLNLKPSVHGGRFWQNSLDSNLYEVKLIDFSASINPLGPPQSVIDEIKGNLQNISHYRII